MPCLRIDYDGPEALTVYHFASGPGDMGVRLKAVRFGKSNHLTVRRMPPGNYVVEYIGPHYPISENAPGSDWEPRIRHFAGTGDERIRPNI